jgi:hypothetical protein
LTVELPIETGEMTRGHYLPPHGYTVYGKLKFSPTDKYLPEDYAQDKVNNFLLRRVEVWKSEDPDRGSDDPREPDRSN